MEIKELKITPPEGYEIDKENSTLECIKFKKKLLTYEDIAKTLFNPHRYFINAYEEIQEVSSCYNFCSNTNATSKKQLEKLLAINKLLNVAKYLNGNWKPDWNNEREVKYSIFINNKNNYNVLGTIDCTIYNSDIVYFKSRELAKQAINILGEDTTQLALSTNW